MTILAGISGKQAIKRFEQIGYTVVRQKGSHVRLKHPKSNFHRPITIPLHKELGIGLLKQLIRDAGIDIKTFLNL